MIENKNREKKIIEKSLKKNRDVTKAFLNLSKAIRAEIDMEFCKTENGEWNLYKFSTDNDPYSVIPISNDNCRKAINVHTHPKVNKEPDTGKSIFSMNDLRYYDSRLLDPNDNLECGCVIGEESKIVKCRCNLDKTDNDMIEEIE